MTPQQDADQSSRAANDDLHEVSTTAVAVGLCRTPAIAWSVTPLQLQVFQQLYTQQMAAAGPYSLLPRVMEGFLRVARRGDVGVAGIDTEKP